MEAERAPSSALAGRSPAMTAGIARRDIRAKLSAGELLVAAAIFALAAILASTAQGRDLNWDYFSYHGYAALQNLQDRRSDFFAAGYQGYLNPLPYAPFALMQAAGWHSLVIASVLAVIQSTNVLFLYLLCRELTANVKRTVPLALTLTACGCASSVLIGQLGSSFVDTNTTPPVMAAIWLLSRRQDGGALVVACALAGFATALKLTNAPFALGVCAMVLAIVTHQKVHRLRHIAVSIAALVVGFAAAYGSWGWQLQTQFGSPVFPLFNQLFASDDFPARSTSFHRFIPADLLSLLTLPFRLVAHESWIYTEVIAPDIRPAVVCMLAGAVLIRSLHVFLHGQLHHRGSPPKANKVQAHTTVGIFFLVSLAGWIATSTNGRYATPLLLLLWL